MKFSDMPYERVDLEKLKEDFAELERELKAASSAQQQFEIHRRYYKMMDRVQTEMTLAEIRHDIDMTDEFYSDEWDFYDQAAPVISNLNASYQKVLYESPYRPYLEKMIGPVAFKNIELALASINERILPLMQEENALTTRYNKILAGAAIDWHGETLNLSLMNPYLHSADRKIRREAWEKYSAFLASHQEEFDEIYDGLVHNRTKQAEEMGQGSYLTLGYNRMMRNCWTRSDVQEFRKQVKKDFVPFAEQVADARRQRLGLSQLSYIDEGVFSGEGNPAPTGSPEEILAAGKRMYEEMSPETRDFFDFMYENELFDVLGRKHKKTGGYMTYLPNYKAPFIFANFNGTSSDLDVITHECGHAFQGYLAAMDPIREHADITMETAETHSMSMEFFTEPWMELFFGGKKEADRYRQMHFEDAILFVPYGTMVDEFQDICYDDPGLSPAERSRIWRDLEKQYKPHLNYEGNEYYEKGGFWQKQHHIYDCPLYYIDYCIAQSDAFQYKIWMDQDRKAAWDSYIRLCSLSASDFFDRLLPKVGLTVPFEDGFLKYIVKNLSK